MRYTERHQLPPSAKTHPSVLVSMQIKTCIISAPSSMTSFERENETQCVHQKVHTTVSFNSLRCFIDAHCHFIISGSFTNWG